MDYKPTLNLPKTAFPMKGNLPQTEPVMLARWEKEKLYERILAARAGGEPFILHDGPPYANGDIHIGHALNKILKDFIVRYRSMTGRRAPYVPGWDCHGLPIEYALMKELKVTKHQVDIVEFRKKARAYAHQYVGIQREQFKRLGVMGDWEHPYLTLEAGYVAAELRALAELVRKGYIVRARKPVNWCWSCETALAEAEVEYEDCASPSIYVKFYLDQKSAEQVIPRALNLHSAGLVIWTTTPWTLMGNVAVAVHPSYTYAVRKGESGVAYITLEDLPAASAKHLGLDPREPVLNRISGKDLEGLIYRHPMELREGKVVLADYVSAENGTGLVHIAPGFGAEDFAVGRKYGLEVVAPVDSRGRFAGLPEKVASFNGQQVQKANHAVTELLQKSGHLVRSAQVEHPYPHCWRCHEPIIFRATDQWFLSVEKEGLREKLLKVVESSVKWVPPVGRERMTGMIKTRPDWCLSRQRLWGVPVPALVCENPKCKGSWLVPELIERFAEVAGSAPDGVDRWFTSAYKEWIPTDFSCLDCGGAGFTQGTDILDVWFDSGVSHQAVLTQRKEWAPPPADLYLEGSDQHRGWFQVSLLTGVALSGQAPYRGVLTHGFVVDGEGRKMSKSLGNVMAPQKVIDSMGAEVLRLWVAASDYSEDVRISQEILNQTAETYRKIRNTLRFCLANVSDFVMAPHGRTPPAQRSGLNQWVLAELGDLVRAVTRSYEEYAYHKVVKAVHEFCTVALSNFYLDVVKDQLYTSHPDDPGRRDTQTVLATIADALIRMMAPILPVTAEEAWTAFGRKPESVHLQEWPTPLEGSSTPSFRADWRRILQFRDQAMKALEKARESGLIGDPLEAELEVEAGGEEEWKFLEARRNELASACIVSELRLVRGGGAGEMTVRVKKSPGAKCQRCWMRLTSVGQSAEHPALCHRCVAVVQKLSE